MKRIDEDRAPSNDSDDKAASSLSTADPAALRAENERLRRRIAELESDRKDSSGQLMLEQIVLHTLVETCPFRIYAKDLESRFIFGNSELAKAVGVELDLLMGKTDADLFPQELAVSYLADEQPVLRNGQPMIAREEPSADPETGDRWWLLTSKVPLRDPDGKIIGLVGIGLNVTERKRLEQELLQSNNELTQLNRHLLETREQLIQSEKLAALGALVAGIAHELNTPIGNSVLLASTLLENTHALAGCLTKGLTRSQLDSFLAETEKGADLLMLSLQRAADLVTSFKRVAVDRTSAQRRRFNLHEMVSEVLLTLGPSMRKSTHRADCEIPAEITLDSYPGPLGQVLTNLITNAVLHAFDGRQNGEIRIAAALQEDDRVCITVRDDGVGIVKENLARVFDPFFTTKFGQGGSGLGLNIAYNLVRGILGGHIRVASELGQGTCFTITLPGTAPEFSEPQAAAPITQHDAGMLAKPALL